LQSGCNQCWQHCGHLVTGSNISEHEAGPSSEWMMETTTPPPPQR
jgi:hypothetical protein